MTKPKKSKKSKVIQSIKCEYCNGTGYRSRAVDEITVIDAILELRNIRRKHGQSFIGGGFDSDICFSGTDSTIEDMPGTLNRLERSSPAKKFVVSYWQLAAGDSEWITDGSLIDMLRDRMSHMHDIAGKSNIVL